jgi:FlaA1/EpsC-like NDP-sugar epimerase
LFLLKQLLYLPRYQKRIVSIFTDSVCLPFAIWLALSLRLDTFYVMSDLSVWAVAIVTVLSSVFVFARLGLYRAVIRYMSNHAMIAIISGVSLSALVLSAVGFAFQAPIPRSVPIIYWCLALIFLGGSRMVMRSVVHRKIMKEKSVLLSMVQVSQVYN